MTQQHGNGPHSVTGTRTVKVVALMDDLDALPPAIRRRLDEARVFFSPAQARHALNSMTEAEVLAAIDAGEIDAVRRIVIETYGPDHPDAGVSP